MRSCETLRVHTRHLATLAVASALLSVLSACRTTRAAGGPTGAGPMQAAAPPASAPPAAFTVAMVQEGDSIFNNGSCKKCHGANGAGGANGPDLSAGKWQHSDGSFDGIVHVVTTGVPQTEIKDPSHRFNMRPRGGMAPLLTDDQVKAVAAYVWTISHHS